MACQPTPPEAVAPQVPAPAASTGGGEGAAASATDGSDAAGPPGPLLPFARGKGARDLASAPPTTTASSAWKPPSPDETEPRATTPPPAAAAVQAIGEPGTVKLLSAGAAPRLRLRLNPPVGQRAKVRLTTGVEINVNMAGRELPSRPIPPISFTLSTRVLERHKSGAAKYAFSVESAVVQATPKTSKQVLEAMKTALATLKGVHGKATVTERGVTTSLVIDQAGGAAQQSAQLVQGMAQALRQLATPLPKEPVGIGARWRHEAQIVQNGMTLKQVGRYFLRDMNDAGLSIDLVLTQIAGPQRVASPGGTTLDLESLKAEGKGVEVMDLQHLWPQRSRLDVSSKAVMKLPNNKTMRISSKLRVEAKAL